jgi:hypothetical protein
MKCIIMHESTKRHHEWNIGAGITHHTTTYHFPLATCRVVQIGAPTPELALVRSGVDLMLNRRMEMLLILEEVALLLVYCKGLS